MDCCKKGAWLRMDWTVQIERWKLQLLKNISSIMFGFVEGSHCEAL